MLRMLRKFIPREVTMGRNLVESVVFSTSYLIWVFLRPDDSAARNLIGSVAILIPLATAAVIVLWGRNRFSPETKKTWISMSIALLCWLGANVVRLYYLGFRQTELPAFSLADLLNILGYFFIFLTIVFVPFKERYRPSLFRFLLDAFISSGVVAVLGWLVIARPAAQAVVGPPIQQFPLIYPVVDLVLMMIVINTYLANPAARHLTASWGISLVLVFISDYVYSYEAIIQGYEAGSIGGVGWIAGYLLIGQSAINAITWKVKKASPIRQPDIGMQLQNILPNVLVFVLIWFVLVDWRLRGEPPFPGIWLTLILAVALVVRLGIRAGEAELNRYYQLFSGLAEPTFICDLNGKITIANSALMDLLETREKGETSSRYVFKIFYGSNFNSLWLQDIKENSSTIEVLNKSNNKPFLLSLNTFFTDDKKRMIAGVAYDITEQKEQQKALQSMNQELKQISLRMEELNTQLEKRVDERTQTLKEAYAQLEEQNKLLQSLDNLKSDFVSMVSHELRTPLTSLSGGLELLLSRPGRREKDQEAVRLMKNEVNRLTHFVENILNLSSIEAGHLDMRIEAIDISLVIFDVLRSIKAISGSERISYQLPDGLPAVQADESLVHSVITQLIDNALKYAPGGPVSISVIPKARKLRIQIADKGPGIMKEKRKYLFKPFNRLDARDSQTVYGHGLGLYISQRLLTSMNSSLHYAPVTNGGASFYFDLKVSE